MAEASGHRSLEGFHEHWQCSAFRVIENGLDNIHHYFVHRGVLDVLSPVPDPMEGGITITITITITDDGGAFSIPLKVSTTSALGGIEVSFIVVIDIAQPLRHQLVAFLADWRQRSLNPSMGRLFPT